MKKSAVREDNASDPEKELIEALTSMMLVRSDASHKVRHDLASRVARLVCAVLQDPTIRLSKRQERALGKGLTKRGP
jgi:hypothetical protein